MRRRRSSSRARLWRRVQAASAPCHACGGAATDSATTHSRAVRKRRRVACVARLLLAAGARPGDGQALCLSRFIVNSFPRVVNSFSRVSDVPHSREQYQGARLMACCDRCGKSHRTIDCPHFPKPRVKHPDAQLQGPRRNLSPGVEAVMRRGTLVAQAPDGSCLVNSFAYCERQDAGWLFGAATPTSIRRECAEWLQEHGNYVQGRDRAAMQVPEVRAPCRARTSD